MVQSSRAHGPDPFEQGGYRADGEVGHRIGRVRAAVRAAARHQKLDARRLHRGVDSHPGHGVAEPPDLNWLKCAKILPQ